MSQSCLELQILSSLAAGWLFSSTAASGIGIQDVVMRTHLPQTELSGKQSLPAMYYAIKERLRPCERLDGLGSLSGSATSRET
jgi:hypothetical protein